MDMARIGPSLLEFRPLFHCNYAQILLCYVMLLLFWLPQHVHDMLLKHIYMSIN